MTKRVDNPLTDEERDLYIQRWLQGGFLTDEERWEAWLDFARAFKVTIHRGIHLGYITKND